MGWREESWGSGSAASPASDGRQASHWAVTGSPWYPW